MNKEKKSKQNVTRFIHHHHQILTILRDFVADRLMLTFEA